MAFETTLPGPYFYDPSIFGQEQERIFSEMWVCTGRADDIPHAGDYYVVELGGESVIVVRGRDQRVRAFLNVCRHRG
ncbi:MAG: Rieske 2Fe-2S domain-containing protein, partial [Chloroflexota bacterium]|nr:Rieske 2Fe-2S domain-containing protein [Chloroflexota bacterium]